VSDNVEKLLLIIGVPISWIVVVWMATSAIATNRSIYLIWKYLISDEAIRVYGRHVLTKYATTLNADYAGHVRQDKKRFKRSYLSLFVAYSFLAFHLFATILFSIEWIQEIASIQEREYGIAHTATIIFGWMCILGFLIVYRHTNLLLKLDAQYPNDVRRKSKQRHKG
jgi:hypothetical protein